jgi:hypothetical protein
MMRLYAVTAAMIAFPAMSGISLSGNGPEGPLEFLSHVMEAPYASSISHNDHHVNIFGYIVLV